MELFRDRREAGRRLAQAVQRRAPAPETVVLALPRGGVPVAYEVAAALHAPLDIFLVRKLGVPGQEELAFGALASGGIRVLNEDVVAQLGLSPARIEQVTEREAIELARRERTYRGDRAAVPVAGRPVVVIDDGLATGASMQAAVEGLRTLGPTRLTVAVPVAAQEACQRFERLVDEVVCAATPWPFYGVGAWYEDFRQTTDEEVRRLLEATAAVAGRPGSEET